MSKRFFDFVFGLAIATSVIEGLRGNFGGSITMLSIAIFIKLWTQGEP